MNGDFHPGAPPLDTDTLVPYVDRGVPPYLPPQIAQANARQRMPANGLHQIMGILLRYWKLIGGCALLALLLAPLVLALLTPVYEADALLQVEAADSSNNPTLSGEISGMAGQSAPVSAEIELLKSRLILGAVIEQMHLNRVAEPHRMPRLQAWLANKPGLRDGLLAMGLLPSSFAWGDERIEIGRMELPERLLGQELDLYKQQDGQYAVYLGNRLLLNGAVGLLASAMLEEGQILLEVNALEGAVGKRFDLRLDSETDTIRSLLGELRASEQGKDSGLIRVSFRGSDPERITQAVNIAINEYQSRDVRWRTAKASRTLDFLNTQLPALKEKVEKAEAALARHKSRNNAPDLTTETSLLLQQSVQSEQTLQELRLEREKLRQTYTENHPNVIALNQQIEQTSGKKGQIDSRIRRLPGSQRELATLTRNVEVNTSLFVAMLEETQQLSMAQSGTLGSVRIVDPAVVPSEAIFPRPGIVLAAALILGLAGGGFLAVLLLSTRRKVESVADMEEAAGPCCLAAIPYSPQKKSFSLRRLLRKERRPGSTLLSIAHHSDPAQSGIRMLSAAVLTDRMTADGGIILLGGFDAGVGRSFVISSLALTLMKASLRIVVVDTDLEGRGLSRYFSSQQPGVSDWLSRRANQIEELIEPGNGSLPDYVSAGDRSAASVAALTPHRLRSLLAHLRMRYDYVLVNAPPMSRFADSLIVAKESDAVIVIGRQLQHRSDEVLGVTNRLFRAGAPVLGTVLNQVRRSDHFGYLGPTSLA